MNNDKLMIGGHSFDSRFILGSGKYSLKLIEAAVRDAGAQIITLAVRRANTTDHENILDYIPEGVTLLPNTSGARNAQEAVRIARLARELGCGDFVKIEIMRDTKYLLPDNQETIKATEILAKEGFVVMPYMYPDLNAARDMASAGAAAIMPLGAPIGSNKGLATKEFIQILIDEIDLHLHPEWQQRVVNDLHRTFPCMQFIVSTHAPLVIGSLKEGKIFSVQDARVFDFPLQYGRDANAILNEMGTSEMAGNIKSELQEYFILIEKGEGKSERALNLRHSLEQKLGPDHTEMQRADLMLSFF